MYNEKDKRPPNEYPKEHHQEKFDIYLSFSDSFTIHLKDMIKRYYPSILTSYYVRSTEVTIPAKVKSQMLRLSTNSMILKLNSPQEMDNNRSVARTQVFLLPTELKKNASCSGAHNTFIHQGYSIELSKARSEFDAPLIIRSVWTEYYRNSSDAPVILNQGDLKACILRPPPLNSRGMTLSFDVFWMPQEAFRHPAPKL